MIPLKQGRYKTQAVNAKYACNVDEYFQNIPAALHHISSQAPSRTKDLKSLF